MFGSTILDVAAGIIFGFLAISLFTSAAVEAINSVLNARVKNLRTGIMALVNDPNFNGLAKQLYAHALISPLGPGAADPLKNAPAYIDKTQFAEAMLDITGLSAATPAAAAQAPAVQAAAELKARMDVLSAEAGNFDPQIKQLLQGMVTRCGGDINRLRTDLANWFDNGMDRLSGEFKRRTQWMTFVIALVAAFVVNLDTIRVGTVLWSEPALGEKLKNAQFPASNPKTIDEAITNGEQVVAAMSALAQEGFPVGWAPGHFLDIQDNQGHWAALWLAPPSLSYRPLLGWFITAVAALFGAPFWFDMLQSIIRLKGAGPSPDDKATKRAASS
ncbi:MAG: hypothetical protein WCF81_00415 [Roseiarcus sp.]